MAEQVLLPSPNWFLTNVGSCSTDGTLAYGSRKDIVIVHKLKIKEGSPPAPDFHSIPNAHRDKVTAVAFCQRNLESLKLPELTLASASEDSEVIIWDANTLEMLRRHKKHNERVTCMDWTCVGEVLLVTGDDRGKLLVWDIGADALRVLPLLNSTRLAPYALACSPTSQDLVVVGCKDGMVCLLSIKGTGQLINRMRGHDKTVVSVSWCPWTQSSGNDDEPLLASGGLDQQIHIWQPKTGVMVKTLQMPSKQLGTGFKARPENSKGNVVSWLPLQWLRPTLLLSGSSSSELLAWNPLADKPTSRLIHSEHLRGLACIAAPPCKCSSSEDWRAPEDCPVVWSLAQDRRLVRCVVTPPGVVSEEAEGPSFITLPTLGGFVYCMAPCPFAPGRVAIGVGDETIRVWNMCDTNCVDVAVFWQRIKGKVTALAWHPEKEGLLAFGTSDGRVGICNVSNPNKEPVVFRQYHRSTVYRVAWGPPTYIKGDAPPASEYVLYACDETTSVYYDPADPQKGPTLLKSIIQACNPAIKGEVKHKELCWKSDWSLLALGLEDGCVQLFSTPHLRCVHTLLAHKKNAYFLLFHPMCTATDDGLAQQRHWLASASTDQRVHIFDLTSLVPDEEGGEWKSSPLPIEPFATLKHGDKAVSLAWNPHISGQLATCSYDKTVKVWDVATQSLLACYIGHTGCVLTCCWSMLDPDVMLSGSADFTVHAWHISATSPDNQASRRENKTRVGNASIKSPTLLVSDAKESSKNASASNAGNKTNNSSTKKTEDTKKSTKLNLFPVSGPASNKKEKAVLCCLEILCADGVLPKNDETTDVKHNSENSSEEVQKSSNESNGVLEKIIKENGDSDKEKDIQDEKKEEDKLNGEAKCGLPVVDAINMGYFTSSKLTTMIDADCHALKQSGNFIGMHHLKLWSGNLHETLKTAAQTKYLSDWLVSLAPSVSHKVWVEMCVSYAEQLEQEGDYLKAASYLLVCHKVLEAVTLLTTYKLFREAATVCQCRLGPEDPTTKSVLLQWAKHSTHQGSFELAVQCYVAAKDYKNAATVLSRRKDPQLWHLGSKLARLAGDDTLAASLACESLFAHLINEQWTEANQISEEHISLQPLKLLVETHQLLHARASMEPPGEEQLACLWSGKEADKISVLSDVGTLCEGKELYEELKQLLWPGQHVPQIDTYKEYLLQVAKLLLLAAAARVQQDEGWEHWVVEALHIGYRRGMLCVKERPLQSLLSWLGCPMLTKLVRSEQAFICAAMLDSLDRDSADAPALLTCHKETLLDGQCAAFSRLKVLISEKEKETAAHAGSDIAESLQTALNEARSTKEALEQERVAFPNPLIIFCKLQDYIEYFKEKKTMTEVQLEEWTNDLNTFRLKLQK